MDMDKGQAFQNIVIAAKQANTLTLDTAMILQQSITITATHLGLSIAPDGRIVEIPKPQEEDDKKEQEETKPS